ncbi:uncharacterized mitochondrial protein AtMg00810-like [Lycium barbarum]|uniref:uncharacterized mitochondrial protein AtMg00810-like n=1 Tax=Lycium barbarum TaxID=112863 RepID=UPI00293E7386|nr:uncharacterized mitochondrial protein AtMg00810-like [Lycium barbarum]
MAMEDEYKALIKNQTWELVPRPPNVHVGVDCGDTFSPVVKPVTIRTVLSLDVSNAWPIHQLDVKNAFLHGELEETVYMHQLDLGPLSYFLGIAVTRYAGGLFLSQKKYAEEIIERASMSSCRPSATPVDTKPKLSATSTSPFKDPSLYRSLAGALQYLTFTRPDISYAVQQICLFMHNPMEVHMNDLKRIVRYIKGTLDHGLHLYPSKPTTLISYTDADWGGSLDTRRSTSGYCVFLGDNLISWSAKRQATMSRSSAEAEYRGVANVVVESFGYAICF